MGSLKVTVENICNEGERKILVYNSSNNEYCSIPDLEENTIGTKKEFSIPPALEPGLENCLVITPVPGSDRCTGSCNIYLPYNSNANANITPSGIKAFSLTQSEHETSLIIPHSPRPWQLKIATTYEATQESLDDEPKFTINVTSLDGEEPPDKTGGGIGPGG